MHHVHHPYRMHRLCRHRDRGHRHPDEHRQSHHRLVRQRQRLRRHLLHQNLGERHHRSLGVSHRPHLGHRHQLGEGHRDDLVRHLGDPGHRCAEHPDGPYPG